MFLPAAVHFSLGRIFLFAGLRRDIWASRESIDVAFFLVIPVLRGHYARYEKALPDSRNISRIDHLCRFNRGY